MTITQFLALFHPITDTKKGWDVCCPAHDDQHPSLGVMEGEAGRIVLNCFAGCTPESICTVLGLTMADLFQDRPINGDIRPLVRPWKPISPRKRAFAYELHALDLRRQAEKILAAAKACEDCDTWTDAVLDWAMKVVSRAYIYHERAQWCEDYADHLREQEWSRTHVFA
jgi:hypothetical protein